MRAKYTPRTNLTICTSGISPCRELGSQLRERKLRYDPAEIAAAISIAVPAAAAPKTAQLPMAVAKEDDGETRENELDHARTGARENEKSTKEREMIYGTAQLYPNVKLPNVKGRIDYISSPDRQLITMPKTPPQRSTPTIRS